jgi:hypothetical protein
VDHNQPSALRVTSASNPQSGTYTKDGAPHADGVCASDSRDIGCRRCGRSTLGCQQSRIAPKYQPPVQDLSGALPAPDYLDTVTACNTNDKFGIKVPERPKSAWLETERRMYSDALARTHADSQSDVRAGFAGRDAFEEHDAGQHVPRLRRSMRLFPRAMSMRIRWFRGAA